MTAAPATRATGRDTSAGDHARAATTTPPVTAPPTSTPPGTTPPATAPSPPPAAPLDAAATTQAEAFLALLAKWNRVYNLTAITGEAEMRSHHVHDSLAILAPLDRQLATIDHPRILDVGCGAGLPGIPLAIARPHWDITLLDSANKKVTFVRQAIAELGLANAHAVHARAEDVHPVRAEDHRATRADDHRPARAEEHRPAPAPYDLIVSRAFASLADFIACTRHLLAPGGTWAAMKGTRPDDELRALPPDITCTDILRLEVEGLAAERHLLFLKVIPA